MNRNSYHNRKHLHIKKRSAQGSFSITCNVRHKGNDIGGGAFSQTRCCGLWHRLDVTKRILVVDDRNELLHLMRRVLEDEQYLVSIWQEGKDAFARVKSLLPDLLILDLKLGDMSGQDILKQLKADTVTADIPVIVYTAAVLEAEEVSRLIEESPETYEGVYLLRKPFELDDLLDKVEELLAKSSRSGHGGH